MLNLRPTKTGLRFEYTDDDAETVVSIDKADTEADTVRKLRRVIALVEGGEGAPPPKVDPLPQGVSDALEKAYDAPPVTNGWAAPVPPARWAGEVELIPPGEDA